ncbi:MAG: DUF736 domain-containing protein [Magnetococcus sp. YQC-3]
MSNTLVKIGAIWEKTSKKGDTFFSGKFGDAQLLILKNNSKKSDKSPDYLVYVDNPQRKEESTSQEFGQPPLFNDNEEIPF